MLRHHNPEICRMCIRGLRILLQKLKMKLLDKKHKTPALKGGMAYVLVKAALVFGIIFSLQGRGIASAPTSLLDSANTAYSKGNFEKAAQSYEAIISLGYESPEVYFNLGNAYYKLDRIGMSI